MKKVIIALFIFSCFSTAFAQDVDLLWKARGLQALENLEKIEKQIKPEKRMQKDNFEKLKHEAMLESAYAMIISYPDITVKKTPILAAYHLILSYGDDGALDVAYLYDIKTYQYLGVRIDRTPKNRGVIFLQENQYCDLITITNYDDPKEPMLIFSKRDPFKARVVILKPLCRNTITVSRGSTDSGGPISKK